MLAYPDPPLADDSVLLRRWEITDLPAIEEASRDQRIPEMTSVPPRFTETEGIAFVDRQWSRIESGEGISLAIAEIGSNRAVGSIVVIVRPPNGLQRGTGEVGYWLVESVRGRRYAARALAMFVPWMFEHSDLVRLEALVEPHNVASQRALEAAEFQLEGRLRSYLSFPDRHADALIYARLRNAEAAGSR